MRWSRRSRKLFSWIFLAAAALGLTAALSCPSPANAVTAQYYADLDFPPLGSVQIPDYERYELPNGLVVYLMEDHDLPLVSGSMTFRTGQFLEPANQVSLGSLTGEAMRLGGTETLSPDELNQQLEQRAASVEVNISTTAGSASFNALSEDTADVFALFADVIRHPAFAPEKIELIKRQYEGSIARRNDNPDDITGREFRKLVYGEDSPYARTVEYANLSNIQRQDVIDFYKATIQSRGSILGISGDFDPAQMKALIAQAFDDWQSVGAAVKQTFEPPEASQQHTGVFMVDQPQLTQSYIQIGHLGGKLNDPYYPPMEVLNEALNGLGGRLFNDIRSRQGLAYSVYAYWSPRYDYSGLFIGGGQTRSEATVPFIQSVVDEIKRVCTEEISVAELQYAKDAVLNSFVFNFATPE
ncbi:MAG: insulinase family protein, partial [Leptolyngbya sp. SIO4C1]|nr:insulinase family protein [Leptolyngbya sp. SIO4C1]